MSRLPYPTLHLLNLLSGHFPFAPFTFSANHLVLFYCLPLQMTRCANSQSIDSHWCLSNRSFHWGIGDGSIGSPLENALVEPTIRFFQYNRSLWQLHVATVCGSTVPQEYRMSKELGEKKRAVGNAWTEESKFSLISSWYSFRGGADEFVRWKWQPFSWVKSVTINSKSLDYNFLVRDFCVFLFSGNLFLKNRILRVSRFSFSFANFD